MREDETSEAADQTGRTAPAAAMSPGGRFRDTVTHTIGREMPAGLAHQHPGELFKWEQSEVIQWIADQPLLLAYLFERLRFTGAIVFDKETRTWRRAKTPRLVGANEGMEDQSE